MGVNISGSGILSGLASLVMGAVNNLNLLVTRIIGYTTGGGGGSSYYTTMVGASGTGLVALNSGAATYSSLDGEDWTQKQIDLGDTTFNGLTYVNNKYFAVSTFGKVVSSEDGVNWTIMSDLGPLGLPPAWGQMMYGQGMYVLVNGFARQAVYSTDAINWSQETITTDNTQTFGNKVGQFVGGKFVLISVSGQTYYSLDGIYWQAGTNLGGTNWYKFAYINNKYVAVNFGGSTASSVDGITWTLGTVLPDSVYDSLPFYGLGKYIIVGRDAKTAYSTDGVTWSSGTDLSVSIYPSEYLNEIDGKIVGFGVNAMSGNIVVISSSDGINWNVTMQPNIVQNTYPYDIYYVNNKYITCSQQGEIVYSLDGIEWLPLTNLPWNSFYTGFALGNVSTLVETQIAIGDQGSGGAEILAPVDVYTVPANKTASIIEVRIKNTSSNPITYDFGILGEDVPLTDQNATIDDAPINAGATQTIEVSANLTAGQRVVVFPSAVDVVEVKVYGTESNA